MKKRPRIAARGLCIGLAVVTFVLTRTEAVAQVAPAGAPTADQLKKLAAEGYETDPEVLKAIATGGTPDGRWKEGLTFDGVAPMPWLKSAANWFPKTEEVQPDEIRVTFMGSSHFQCDRNVLLYGAGPQSRENDLRRRGRVS